MYVNLHSPICRCITQGVVAILGRADGVVFGDVLDADGDIGHKKSLCHELHELPRIICQWY